MLRDRTIFSKDTILEAFRKMDFLDKKLLVVIESGKFAGLISAGDIQRAIIQNKPLDTIVKDILRENIKIAKPGDSFDEIKKMMFDFRMELCPVVNVKNEILEVYFWEDIFRSHKPQPLSSFDLPVVIMAGGFGTRMKPLTNVLPKPLLPFGERTILEEIIQRFSDHGCKHFFISINYKADLIRFYIKNLNLSSEIEFCQENKPLGTAGSLKLLNSKINQTFFVSNCDILIEQDYSEILKYHRENKNEMTIVAALRHYPIAYGTLETGLDGRIIKLSEKPELTFKINTGMYILEPHLLDELPDNKTFHITDLIEKIKERGGNLGAFPVSERSWRDLGDWNEYIRSAKNI